MVQGAFRILLARPTSLLLPREENRKSAGGEGKAEKWLDRIISLVIIPSVKLPPNKRLNPTLFLIEAKPEGVGARGLRT
jgi:hypothetical protein